MSEIIASDTWEGQVTRIYVWYPDDPAGAVLPDWEHDSTIVQDLQNLRANDQYELSVARYYHNPRPTGQVIVIARLRRG